MNLRVVFPIQQLKAMLDQARTNLQRELPTVLRSVGEQLLSFARRDYTTLSRGGATADGRQWKPLSPSTVAARVRNRPTARRIISQRHDLARQIRNLNGPQSSKRKAVLRKRRAALGAQLKSMIGAELTQAEIGIDTGMQQAAGRPGFVGPDGLGNNILKVDTQNASVTVGYGRDYSNDFDVERPILPDSVPESWIDAATSTVQLWAEHAARKSVN